VLKPTTLSFLDRAGLRNGMSCLDVGCGGGDVTFEIARLAGPAGRVVGLDIDPVKIELAQNEASELGLSWLEFRLADIAELNITSEFDLVYSRFLLTHLSDPASALSAMLRALKPGGIVVLEDIDFRAHFCHPESEAFTKYVALYTEVVRRNGGDANIGARLPELMAGSGGEKILLNVIQPAGMDEEVKSIAAITMENVADAMLKSGLSSAEELDRIVDELYALSRDNRVLMGFPRIVQVAGKRRER
jgi:ubiquinone/menaquinone biosynthesis C-methylase UbiE